MMVFLYARMGYNVRKTIALVMVLTLFSVSAHEIVIADEVEEYKVKAAFVYNFIRFTKWPATAYVEKYDQYRLCFTGDESVAKQFYSLNGKTNGEKVISVSRLTSSEGCRDCDVLFISRATQWSVWQDIIQKVAGFPVLTIGEIKRFEKNGEVIIFFLKDDRLHFEINPNAAGRQGVKMSSRLLKLAVIVDGG